MNKLNQRFFAIYHAILNLIFLLKKAFEVVLNLGNISCASVSNTGSRTDAESSDARDKEMCERREDNLSNAPEKECPLEGGKADATSILSKYRTSTGAGTLALS